MGLERLLLLMEKQNCDYLTPKKCDIYFAVMGEAALEKAMQLSKSLREYGYYAEYDMMGRGLKAQMKYANKIGAVFSVVIGDNEIADGKAKVKHMESGETLLDLDDRFTAVFEEIYFNRIMEALDDETKDSPLFSFTGEEQ